MFPRRRSRTHPEDPPDPVHPPHNAVIEPATAVQQTGLAGSVVAAAPGVRVLVDGQPVPDVTVQFASQDDYGGAVNVTHAQTDAQGDRDCTVVGARAVPRYTRSYSVNLLAADPWRLPVASLQEGRSTSVSFGCEPLPGPEAALLRHY